MRYFVGQGHQHEAHRPHGHGNRARVTVEGALLVLLSLSEVWTAFLALNQTELVWPCM